MENTYENIPKPQTIPKDFLFRRAQSLAGLFLVLFLIEHLFTNSQAALFFDEGGGGFIRMVNFLKSLPYLPVIEITLIGFPLLVHGALGISYLFSARYNSMRSDGTRPALPEFSRNHAYTWQRFTAMILVLGIIGHVVTMRFLDEPKEFRVENKTKYTVSISMDSELPSLAARLGVQLQLYQGKVIAEAENVGTAFLLVVRDTFKSPTMCILYTVFVLAACFHASNGLWTFCISWGITLNEYSRRCLRVVSNALMALLACFGLISIWMSYFIVG